MKNDPVFISDSAWFQSSSLKNPINVLDHKLEAYFPAFYSVDCDTKILTMKAPSAEEKAFPGYNNDWEQFGTTDIADLDKAICAGAPKHIFLNGFQQQQFSYIAPKLTDTAEVIYFFKCPKIHDLSVLSQFKNLKCVHIYWNHSLESLWDMTNNQELKVISCTAISKLKNIDTLKDSLVEYVCLDSSDNNGHRKPILFDPFVFDQMRYLKHLSLIYSDYFVNR